MITEKQILEFVRSQKAAFFICSKTVVNSDLPGHPLADEVQLFTTQSAESLIDLFAQIFSCNPEIVGLMLAAFQRAGDIKGVLAKDQTPRG